MNSTLIDRRWLVTGALGVTAATVLASCGPKTGSDGSGVVLKVGSQKGGTKALLLASGVLAGAPYRIEWSEFAAAQPLLEALAAGAVDLGEAGDAPFLFAFANGAPLKAVLTGRTGGSSTALLVRKDSPITTPADLRGRKIATGRGSIGHYLLLQVLRHAGLAPKDVAITFLSPGDAKAAFSTGAIDVWVTWGPYIPIALQGGARILVSGEGLISGYGFEVASDAAISGKRPLVADLIQRLVKARRWALEHTPEDAAVLARETGLSPSIALYTAEHYRAQPVVTDASVIGEARAVLDEFRSSGAITGARDIGQAFDTSFNGAVTA